MRTVPDTPVPDVSDVDADLRAHLATLRLDPRSANPAGWRVDWDDGPWPVTVRTGGTRLALRSGPGDPLMDRVDRLLRGTFAMGRVRFDPHAGLPATPDDPLPRHHGPRVTARRPIPSGGSMYPTEAYLLLTGPDRLCHHDPYRHELVDLGCPAPSVAVRAALGDAPAAPVLLVLTHRFWKNFYKYGDFAYRLGAVDVGVALGRALRLGAAAFGRARLRADFDDEALGACLGLDPADEGPYAVVELGTGAGPAWTAAGWGGAAWFGSGPAATSVVERSRRVRRSSRFAATHAAATHAAGSGATRPATGPGLVPGSAEPAVSLPAPDPVDLLDPAVLARRTSNGRLFRAAPAGPDALATVLAGTATGVRRLHTAAGAILGGDVVLLCAVHRVSGIPAGWYRYRPGHDRAGDLVPVGRGADPGAGRALQDALLADSVNVELAAFTVHVGAAVDAWSRGRGARGYREQQLAVGAAVEAVTLLSTAVGLGSHPVLGFDVGPVEAAYGLAGSETGVHAQVSVGPVRPDTDWEISVVPV